MVLDQKLKVTFYINGVNAGNVNLTSWANGDDDGVVTIGAQTDRLRVFDYFTGTLDELQAYSRPLNTSEIKAIYTNQFFWYRDEASTDLTVDSDNPDRHDPQHPDLLARTARSRSRSAPPTRARRCGRSTIG